jgi:hypothetical protein
LVLLLPRIVLAGDSPVDFSRDIRPILAQNCFQCHGPDDAGRQAGLRLDERAAATTTLESGQQAIAPGNAAASELLERISTNDENVVMPPLETGKHLSAEQIAMLRRWIEQGAPYARHWAYVKPLSPALPPVRDTQWPTNPIDRFVLARLEAEGLAPAEAADRYTLIRRVSLDLLGLPPTPEEVNAFVNDTSSDAYERLVDRLLGHPAFGERWAAVWLDLARYADSQGYAPDGPRTIWRWRDWVIQALNKNLPYDQFTILQLAGDLLPGATTTDRLASGFHRNTQLNTEGGINLEEFRHAAIVDRVNTTFAVWMGSSFACAQCHNHKYDPFTQREYYQIFAIFNNTDDFNTDDPVIEVPRVGQEAEYDRLKLEIAQLRRLLEEATAARDKLQAEWEETINPAHLPSEVIDILAVLPEHRDQKQRDRLANYHRGLSDTWQVLDSGLSALEARFESVRTTVPVMREGTPRQSYVFHRGEYQSPGELVQPGVPAALHPAPADMPLDRLGLAHWLMDAENPLTARVAVNRLWQELFGLGIVETAEEFGTQGEPPSHPDLLDWLAVEYRESGWDTKHMLKLMVTSATYQQSSKTTPASAQRDPRNRLLARGPRGRVSAEMLRDQALAISGLLSRTMYGPPVQPPQPTSGLAAAFGGTTDWKPSEGPDRYRRAIYTRWRRNLPYPAMIAFDAPDRNICSLRRMRTNTPLQALVTLNDPVFVECAQAFARRIIAEGGDSTASRVRRAMDLAVNRPATPQEVIHLTHLYEASYELLKSQPDQALALATNPAGPLPEGIPPLDAAAWTVVANVVLNLDETLNKP